MKTLNKLLCISCIALFMFLPVWVHASKIVEVRPLTDRILMIHFNDGYVTYHKLGASRSSDVLHVNRLDLTEAMKVESYNIISPDDENYSTDTNPTDVGRKSKGVDFKMSTAWDNDWKDSWASEHWIYVFLPEALQQGKNYTVTTAGLAEDKNAFTFTYDEKDLDCRSEAIHVNQVGHLPSAPKKFGYVYHWMGDKGGLDLSSYAGKTFWIVNASTNEVRYTGELKFRAAADNQETSQPDDTPNANFLGADVYECDFSAFKTPGRYRLAVEGIGSSFPFDIGEDIYRESFKTTARGLYHNRSGIELEPGYTEYTRPAPHNPELTPGFEGKLRYTTVRSCDIQTDGGDGDAIRKLVAEGDKGEINTWGWYQDAGDWDGYPSHLRVPALLLLAYEMAPEKFADNELNIPGDGNGIPDILDEASWLIEYLHRTRHAIMDAGYGTGGVSGRVCGDYWGSDMIDDNAVNGSWGDTQRTWYVFGEDPMNTYMYAGLAAQYAYLLTLSGKTSDVDWRQEAVEAYVWAEKNTREDDEHAPHAAISLNNARAYAAVNLYKLTGKNTYHDRFIKETSFIGRNSNLSDDMRLGVSSYLLLEPSRTLSDVTERFKSAIGVTAGQNVSSAAARRGCRWGGDFSMPMLIGQGTTPWVLDALLDYRINGNQNSFADALTTVDYFMGTNPMNHIWFTGEKDDIVNPERRHVRGIFHMDSWYNDAKEDREVPGFSPYGPWRQERDLTPNINNGAANNGWWCNEWSYNSAYPAMDDSDSEWPGHERWFNPRYAPLAAENTIHQNTVYWAITTGLLCKNITSNPFDSSRLPDAEPYEELPDDREEEEEEPGERFIIADFDTKGFYTDDNIAGAPEDAFKVFTPGGAGSMVNNPLNTGINETEKVFEFTKNADTWQVWGFEPKPTTILNFKNYTHLEFMVYGGSLNSIQLIINNPDSENPWISQNIPVSAVDSWQKISIELPKEGVFSSVLLFPNSNIDEGGAKSYYDNFRFRIAENFMTVADFDEKVLYLDEEINNAPEGSFKIYTTGTVEQPVDNPDKTSPNLSDKVMKFAKGDGSWKLFGLETQGQQALDINRFSRLEFKVKGNISEIYVAIPDLVDSRMEMSIDNKWTLISVDLSEKNGSFTNINIFPNPVVEEPGAVFFFDDFRLYEKLGYVKEEPSGKETLLLLDFENIELGWGPGQQNSFAFNSADFSIIPNPDKSQPNTSEKVLFWKKDGSEGVWGGYGFRLSENHALNEWTDFVFEVYSEEPIKKASVSFTNFIDDENSRELGSATDFDLDIPANQWTTVSLSLADFGGSPSSEWEFNQFILFLAPEESSSFSTYVDNIRLEKNKEEQKPPVDNKDYHTIKVEVAPGIVLSENKSGELIIGEGESLYFLFSTEDRTLTAKDVILLIDEVETTFRVQEPSYSYFLNDVRQDHTVAIALRKYPITFEEVQGVIISLPNAVTMADYGKPFRFSLTEKEGFSLADARVLVNGTELRPDGLRATTLHYTIDRLTGPVNISVSNVGTSPTGSAEITEDIISITVSNGQLVIDNPAIPTYVSVYTTAGKMMINRLLPLGTTSIALAQGTYIIKADKYIWKISVLN